MALSPPRRQWYQSDTTGVQTMTLLAEEYCNLFFRVVSIFLSLAQSWFTENWGVDFLWVS